MATPGMDEVEEYLDPAIEVPSEVEPDLADILPRGYLSVSQITTVLNCPYSWKLRYVDGLRGRTSVRPFQGIQVHRAVEKVLDEKLQTGTPSSLAVAKDVFSDEFEKSKSLIEDWEGEDQGQVKDTGVKCVEAFYTEAVETATPIEVEKTFSTIVKTTDGKIRLPVLGRIDSIQVQAHTEKEYQDIREKIAGAGEKTAEALAKVKKPRRIHDLKVTTDKWSESDLANDIQFALYAGVEHIPDVQVDQVVKGRAKVPRPRYEALTGVMTNAEIGFAIDVAADVAKTIALGHFSKTNPGNWWCSEKWCSMWRHCRGKQK